MKKLLLALLTFFMINSLSEGKELTGKEIIQKMNDQFNPTTSYSKSKMTVVTSSGKKRTFVSESWSKDKGEKTLVRYISPKRVKGQAILMLNNADDIWSYFPRTKRVRKLASHAKKQKMQGSDFSYEDMGGGDTFIDEYTAKRLDDEEMKGKKCFKIELKRKKGSGETYSRLILWVIKDTFVPIVIDYYDEKDPKLHTKRLEQSNFKTIDGIPTAMKTVMYNKLDNTQTEIEVLDVKFNLKLADKLFTERNLKK